jgi:hypothetical protein
METQLQERVDQLEAMSILKPEEIVQLFVIPQDSICQHVLEYVKQMDVEDHFHIHDVSVADTRPEWLQGVPTVVFSPELSDGKFGEREGHVGEDALRYIRELVEGPQEHLHKSFDVEDDLEVIEVRGSTAISVYDVIERRDPLPDEEEQLLHFLLPLPSSYKTSDNKDVSVTDSDVKYAIAERERFTEEHLDK